MIAKRAEDPATPDPSTRVFTEKETGWPHYTTPDSFLTRVRKVGPIILDPCDNDESLTDADNSFFGPETGGLDGLAENWAHWVRARRYGVIFVNPPYGDQIPLWLEKIAREALALRVAPKWRGTIALIPSRTDTGWFHDRVSGPNTLGDGLPAADAWVFARGRTQFGNPPPPDPTKRKTGRSGSTMANLIVYWGRYVDAFADAMNGLGLLIR